MIWQRFRQWVRVRLVLTHTARLKAWGTVSRALPALMLPAAWALLTWSAFLWSARAWAASTGLFLLVMQAIQFAEAYYVAKARAKTENKK